MPSLLSFASLYDYLLLGLFTPPVSLPWLWDVISLIPSLYEPLGSEQDHHCGQRRRMAEAPGKAPADPLARRGEAGDLEEGKRSNVYQARLGAQPSTY